MDETKTSIQAIQEFPTIGDLLNMNGRMQEFNKNKEIVFIIPSIKENRSNFAEDLINEFNSCEGDNPSDFLTKHRGQR